MMNQKTEEIESEGTEGTYGWKTRKTIFEEVYSEK